MFFKSFDLWYYVYTMAKLIYQNNKPVLGGVKNIFFDLDGTLIDSLGVWRYTDRLFFEQHGLQMPEDFVQKTNAMRYEETVRYAADIVGIEDISELLVTWQTEAIKQYETTIPLKEGVIEYLEYCASKNINMYIVTSGSKEMYEPCIKRLGIDKYIKKVFSANEVGIGKQSGKIYSYALKEIGANIENTVLFEDAEDAIRSANELGILTIGVQDDNNNPLKDTFSHILILYSFKNAPLIMDCVK